MRKTKEKRSKVSYFILIFRLVSLIIIGICLYVLYLWHLDNKSNYYIKQDLKDFVVVDLTPIEAEDDSTATQFSDILDENNLSVDKFNVDFDSLNNLNTESTAWIRIIGTNISYPIVQAGDNDYYINHNIKKEKNGAGWIFADYRNNLENLDKNTIIYGHNRRNGTMFSNLKYYLDTDYCADRSHRYINFNTKKQQYIAEIFSVYKVTPSQVTLPINFESQEAFKQTIDSWTQNSIYDFGTEVNDNDYILTLYTCDNNTAYRIIIHAKLIEV